MIKKIFSLIVIVLFAVTLVACGDNSNGGDHENPHHNRKEVSLTVYSQLANFSGKMQGWFAQIMKEKFNVSLVIVPDAEGTYATRMESGDLGDLVVWGGDGQDYKNAVDQGMLFDWEEDNLVQDYGPFIWENMKDALNKNKELSGGKIYGFGHDVSLSSEDIQSFFYTWDVRWDLYEKAGKPKVKDLDDFFDLMVAMKEIEPKDENGNETYAVSLWPDWDGNMVMYVKAFATAYYGYDELGIGLYDTETGDFMGALDQGSYYLEALKFFNRLYRAGLLDPDSMTNTYDEATSKAIAGGTFFSIFNYSGSLAYNTTKHIEENKLMLSLLPEDAKPIVYGLSTLGGNRVWSIGSKSQYPELAMEIINWLATPEGRMTVEYGPYGENWDYDEDGKTYFTEQGMRMREDINETFGEDSRFTGRFTDGRFEINNTTWALDSENPDSNGETYNWEFWESNRESARNELEESWREFTGFSHHQEYLASKNYKIAIGSSYSEGRKTSELKVIWEQVIKDIVDNSWLAIYAANDGQFNFHVNNMINNAKAHGYQKAWDWSANKASLRWEAEEALRNN